MMSTLGGPPIAPPLTSFSLIEDDEPEREPQRGEDYDLLGQWARSLSVSPRLFPTYGSSSTSSSHLGDTSSSYHSLHHNHRASYSDASPMLAGGLRHDSLSMGTGLSPILGPTYSSGGSLGGTSTSASLGGGSAFDYSTFGQFHIVSQHDSTSPFHSHPHDHPTALLGGTRRPSRSGSHHHHSFSNISNIDPLRSMSPQDLPPPLHSRSSPLVNEILEDKSQLSTSNLNDPVETAEPATEEDPRIRAYAKLEFPSLNIYIKKLSVIVGRRPAGANLNHLQTNQPVVVDSGGSQVPAPVEQVKLEDFVVGMDEDKKEDEVKKEEAEDQKAEEVKEDEMIKVKTEEEASVLPIDHTDSTAAPVVPEPAPAPAPEAEANLDSIIPPPSAEPVPAPILEATPAPAPLPPAIITDIDLGPIRAVSRQHARLYFDYEMGGWAIEVLGRNGVVVEGKWKAKGEKEALGKRTKIQIAERIFYFVLPTIDPAPDTIAVAPEAGEEVEAGEGAGADKRSSDIEMEEDEDAGERSEGDEDEDEDDDVFQDDGDDSSSLSEVSDERSSPVVEESSTSTQKLPTIKLKLTNINSNPSPPKPEASTSKLASLAALAPPVRAAARAAAYSVQYGNHGGKKPEVLQAARNGGKGKGKGKLKKEKTKVPSKKPRRPSNDSVRSDVYLDRDFDDDEDVEMEDGIRDADLDDDDDEDEVLEASMAPPKLTASASKKKKKKKVEPPSKSPVGKHPVPTKQPKRSLMVPAPTLGSTSDPTPPTVVAPKPTELVLPKSSSANTSSASSATASTSTQPSTSTSLPTAGPTTASLPPGVVGAPPVKRGRGRPPKNGICAQRPRKPRPDGIGGPVQTVVAPPQPPAVAAPLPLPPPPPPPPATPKAAPEPVDTSGDLLVDDDPETPGPDGPRPLAAPADDLYSKPPYTYASLIAQAVTNAEGHKLTLNGIYDWITARWPYFSDNQNGWQNSIRHNLSLSRGFLKVARRQDEPGKGAFWMLDPEQASNFDGLHFRKKITKPPSVTGTPTAPTPTATAAPVPPRPTPAATAAPKAVPAKGKPAPAAAKAKGPPPKPGAPSLSTPLPIIISPIPDSYVRPAPPPASSTPPDELTAALLKDPPIVLHEGKLILNPTIFENLSKTQLDSLQVLPASQALQILQAHVVQHFKEKMGRMAKEKLLAKKRAAAEKAAAEKAALEAAGGSGIKADATLAQKPPVNGTGSTTPKLAEGAKPASTTPATATIVENSSAPSTSASKPLPTPTPASSSAAPPVAQPSATTKRKLDDSDVSGESERTKVAKLEGENSATTTIKKDEGVPAAV